MPLEIVGLLRRTITFVWPDGQRSQFSARQLRLMCRCAQCIDETSGAPLLDPASVPDDVRAKSMQLVGQYGLSIEWTTKPCANIYNFQDLRAHAQGEDGARVEP